MSKGYKASYFKELKQALSKESINNIEINEIKRKIFEVNVKHKGTIELQDNSNQATNQKEFLLSCKDNYLKLTMVSGYAKNVKDPDIVFDYELDYKLQQTFNLYKNIKAIKNKKPKVIKGNFDILSKQCFKNMFLEETRRVLSNYCTKQNREVIKPTLFDKYLTDSTYQDTQNMQKLYKAFCLDLKEFKLKLKYIVDMQTGITKYNIYCVSLYSNYSKKIATVKTDGTIKLKKRYKYTFEQLDMLQGLSQSSYLIPVRLEDIKEVKG